jgi:hypothetical protein
MPKYVPVMKQLVLSAESCRWVGKQMHGQAISLRLPESLIVRKDDAATVHRCQHSSRHACANRVAGYGSCSNDAVMLNQHNYEEGERCGAVL